MVKVGGISDLFLRKFSNYTFTLNAVRNGAIIEKFDVRVGRSGMSESKSMESSCRGKVFKVSPDNFLSLIELATETLKNGGVIAIPTDTIYGLAADAQNYDAIRRIYEIKGRDYQKPISICLNRQLDFYNWANIQVTSKLLKDLFPGPLTLVFERTEDLNPNLNPHTNLIGIRYPDFPFVDSLLTHFGGPLALTSANPSSAPSTLAAEEFKELWPSLDYVFDAGRLPIFDYNRNPFLTREFQQEEEATARLGSTVIDVSEPGYFRIIRKGISCDRYIKALKGKHNLIQKSD